MALATGHGPLDASPQPQCYSPCTGALSFSIRWYEEKVQFIRIVTQRALPQTMMPDGGYDIYSTGVKRV